MTRNVYAEIVEDAIRDRGSFAARCRMFLCSLRHRSPLALVFAPRVELAELSFLGMRAAMIVLEAAERNRQTMQNVSAAWQRDSQANFARWIADRRAWADRQILADVIATAKAGLPGTWH